MADLHGTHRHLGSYVEREIPSTKQSPPGVVRTEWCYRVRCYDSGRVEVAQFMRHPGECDFFYDGPAGTFDTAEALQVAAALSEMCEPTPGKETVKP